MHLPHHRKATLSLASSSPWPSSPSPAQAVIVRGKVTTPFNIPLGNVRVQLVQGHQIVAFGISQMDGSFEIRSAAPGRFRLLTTAHLRPQHRRRLLRRRPRRRHPQRRHGDRLRHRAGRRHRHRHPHPHPADPRRPSPSSPRSPSPPRSASSTRSANPRHRPRANTARPAAPPSLLRARRQLRRQQGPHRRHHRQGHRRLLRLRHRLAPPASTAIETLPRPQQRPLRHAAPEPPSSTSHHPRLLPAPSSPTPATPATSTPTATRSPLSGAHKKLDYYAGFGRFDTSNALPLDRYHSATSAANIGYAFSGNTAGALHPAQRRLRHRPSRSPRLLRHLQRRQAGRPGHLLRPHPRRPRLDGRWHNLVRYAITRKREQESSSRPPASTHHHRRRPPRTYYGNLVTIHGANGYTATGQAAFSSPPRLRLQPRRALLPVRLRLHPPPRRSLRLPLRERARQLRRTRLPRGREYPAHQLLVHPPVPGRHQEPLLLLRRRRHREEPSLRHRRHPAPRLRLRARRASRIAGSAAPTSAPTPPPACRSQPSPSILQPLLQLLQAGDTAAITAYNVTQPTAERSRTYDVGVDQNIRAERLVFKAGYFHNVFDHQLECVARRPRTVLRHPRHRRQPDLRGLPELPRLSRPGHRGRDRLAGPQASHHPRRLHLPRLRSSQSFATDAVNANEGMPTTNPNIPGVPIGAVSPLVGARPFRRAPQHRLLRRRVYRSPHSPSP